MQKLTILTKDGEPEGISKMDSDQLGKLRGKTFQSGSAKIGVIDTGVIGEELENLDYQSLARQLGKATCKALRDHGDEISSAVARNVSKSGCTIEIKYKPGDRGEEWEDSFTYRFTEDGTVYLGNENRIIKMSQQSGQVSFSQDLASDAILKFIDSKSNPLISDAPEKSETIQGNMKENDNLILGFRQAVKEYQEDPRNPERIKNLFRQSRGFAGDTLPQKFRAAVDSYKSYVPVEEPSVEMVSSEGTEVISGGYISLSVSLLLRLLEFAKEDATDDNCLHYIAEKAQELSKEGRGLSIRDYNSLVECDNSEQPGEEDEKQIEEISSRLLDKSAGAASLKGRFRQSSAFTAGANESRNRELKIDPILQPFINCTSDSCSVKVSPIGNELHITKSGEIHFLEIHQHIDDSTRIGWPLENSYKIDISFGKPLAKVVSRWCTEYLDDIPEKSEYTDWHNWVVL